MTEFPPEAAAALERGELIEAIRIVREQTGLDLRESKYIVERYQSGDRSPLIAAQVAPVSGSSFDESGLPAAAVAAMARGNKLEAVKLVRDAMGLGLAEAKELVEAHAAGEPLPQRVADLETAAMRAMAEPGRVGASRWASPMLWLVMAVLGAGAWVYFNYFL